MLEPSWWLWGALLPLLVSSVVMIACIQPWRPPSAVRAAIAWPLALSLGYAIGSVVFPAIKHSLSWPPVEAADFLAMVLLPAVVAVEVAGAILPVRAPMIRWVGRGLVIVATPPLMLLPFLRNEWSIWQSIGWCGLLTVGMAVVSVSIHLAVSQRLTDRNPLGRGYEDERESLASCLALTITAAGVGVTILASGSAILGQLGLTLAAAIFGAWLVGMFSGSAKPQAAFGVAIVLLAGLLINGVFYAEVQAWHAAVLALAPLTAWVGRVPPVRKLKRWQGALIVAVITGLVVATAVAPAVIAAKRAMSESGYE